MVFVVSGSVDTQWGCARAGVRVCGSLGVGCWRGCGCGCFFFFVFFFFFLSSFIPQVQLVVKTVQKIAMDRSSSPPDFLVLCRSLVRDGALPGGLLSLEAGVKAAARTEDKAIEITNTLFREDQSSEPTTYEDSRGTVCLGFCARTSTFPKQWILYGRCQFKIVAHYGLATTVDCGLRDDHEQYLRCSAVEIQDNL